MGPIWFKSNENKQTFFKLSSMYTVQFENTCNCLGRASNGSFVYSRLIIRILFIVVFIHNYSTLNNRGHNDSAFHSLIKFANACTRHNMLILSRGWLLLIHWHSHFAICYSFIESDIKMPKQQNAGVVRIGRTSILNHYNILKSIITTNIY